MRSRRADEAAASQRQALAQAMAGGDPLNPSPQLQATMAVAAPEMYQHVLTQLAERRRQEALFGQQDKARTADAAIAQEAAKAQEARVQERPSTTDVAQLRRAAARGEISKEEADAAIKKLTSPSASEQKIINDQAMQSVDAQSSLATLDEALALTNHPKGIHAGPQAGITQSIGENVPKFAQGSSVLPDPETTKNTQRYNQIMGAQALQLLTQMKGASSDKDVAINFKIANDPNASIESKRQAIGVLRNKLSAYLEIHNRGIVEAGGTVPKLPGAGGAATAAPTATGGGDANAEAKAWLAANPDDPRAEAVRKKLGGG
jgi:hypothetical protein